jgi:hypothetical protein
MYTHDVFVSVWICRIQKGEVEFQTCVINANEMIKEELCGVKAA